MESNWGGVRCGRYDKKSVPGPSVIQIYYPTGRFEEISAAPEFLLKISYFSECRLRRIGPGPPPERCAMKNSAAHTDSHRNPSRLGLSFGFFGFGRWRRRIRPGPLNKSVSRPSVS